jgi:wobble nucleotide-excising tRNase
LAVNRIEADLEKESNRTEELEKMLNDLESDVLNRKVATDAKVSFQDKTKSLLTEAEEKTRAAAEPLPDLQKICTRIIEDGIEVCVDQKKLVSDKLKYCSFTEHRL